MKIGAVLDGLLRFGEDDWIPLWVIAGDVEDELGIDDPNENLAITASKNKSPTSSFGKALSW